MSEIVNIKAARVAHYQRRVEAMREELLHVVTEPLRQLTSMPDAIGNLGVAVDAALDTLCYLIVEGWLTAAEQAELPNLSPPNLRDIHVPDRAEQARNIGAELPARVERWAKEQGRCGDYGHGTDDKGVLRLIKQGRLHPDEFDAEFLEQIGFEPD
jgi:hypothetical protein